MQKCYCILFIAIFVSQLMACGQSGKLYLPETPQKVVNKDSQ